MLVIHKTHAVVCFNIFSISSFSQYIKKVLEALWGGHLCTVTFPLIIPFCSCNFPLFRNNTLPHGELSFRLLSLLLFLYELILLHFCHIRLHFICCSTCARPNDSHGNCSQCNCEQGQRLSISLS